jgi:hypothetical protein
VKLETSLGPSTKTGAAEPGKLLSFEKCYLPICDAAFSTQIPMLLYPSSFTQSYVLYNAESGFPVSLSYSLSKGFSPFESL